MKQSNYKVGQIINYVSSASTYCGEIKETRSNNYFVVIDHNNDSAVTLWNLGYSIGSDVHISQILN